MTARKFLALKNQHLDNQNNVVPLQLSTGETVLAAERDQLRKQQIIKILLTHVIK
jgi:hypothetical protein